MKRTIPDTNDTNQDNVLMQSMGSSTTLPQVVLPGMQRSQSDNTSQAMVPIKKRNENMNSLVDQPATYSKKMESFGKSVRTVKEEDES